MRLSLPPPGLRQRDPPGGEDIELAMRLLERLVDQPDARNERRDMRACGLRCSGSDPHWRLALDVRNVRRLTAPDAMALQKLGDR